MSLSAGLLPLPPAPVLVSVTESEPGSVHSRHRPGQHHYQTTRTRTTRTTRPDTTCCLLYCTSVHIIQDNIREDTRREEKEVRTGVRLLHFAQYYVASSKFIIIITSYTSRNYKLKETNFNFNKLLIFMIYILFKNVEFMILYSHGLSSRKISFYKQTYISIISYAYN